MKPMQIPATLDPALCRARQVALREDMRALGCSALLIRGRGNLNRLFNYHARETFPAVGLILTDGPAILCRKSGDDSPVAAETTIDYPAAFLASLRPNLPDLALEALLAHLPKGRIGCDGDLPLWLSARGEWVDARPQLATRCRSKDADEITLIAAAAAASEAAYAAVAPLIVAGTREIDLFAAFQSAAVSAADQPIGELGNDYRGGAAGGEARTRPLQAGELAVLDTGVMLRGYYSDLCRSYPVGGVWSAPQRAAAKRVVEALALAETLIAPGVSCAAVYRQVTAFLDGWQGNRFDHHLGHGIGLLPVETPRINPHWDDHFQIGDVFTLEPGLYGPDLRAGVRIENDYVLTDAGLRRLSDSATCLAR